MQLLLRFPQLLERFSVAGVVQRGVHVAVLGGAVVLFVEVEVAGGDALRSLQRIEVVGLGLEGIILFGRLLDLLLLGSGGLGLRRPAPAAAKSNAAKQALRDTIKL